MTGKKIMKNILITNKQVLNVENNNGVLKIRDTDGAEIKNPGLFISTMGGVSAILNRCKQTEKSAKEIADGIKAEKVAKKAANAPRVEAEKATLIRAYEALASKGKIETTPQNIEIVLRYLNTQNWGMWKLPKMSIGYKVNQYQISDIQTATTMRLDEPINFDGKKTSKFVVGAPVTHLANYTHLR